MYTRYARLEHGEKEIRRFGVTILVCIWIEEWVVAIKLLQKVSEAVEC